MEISKNRYGSDRTIEKISPTRLRVMGESLVIRDSFNDKGECTMFDFEGGPCLTVGGKIKYGKTDWLITKILPENSGIDGLFSVILEVKL
jgi:hypothetical protein